MAERIESPLQQLVVLPTMCSHFCHGLAGVRAAALGPIVPSWDSLPLVCTRVAKAGQFSCSHMRSKAGKKGRVATCPRMLFS